LASSQSFPSLQKFRQALLEFDPGYANLLTAIRGTSGTVLAFIVLSYLAKQFNQPPMLSFLGVMLAMNGSIFVRDPGKRGQQISILAMPIPALIGLGASVLLEPWTEARMAGLLIIIFLAVSLRRLGNRWIGLGIIGFLSYFLPLFIPVPIASLPFTMATVVIAILISYVIRFYLLPDRPEVMLRHYLETFELRRTHVIDSLRHLVNQPEAGWGTVDLAFVALNDLSLTIEEFLKTTGSRAVKKEADTLQMRIFERELNLRQLSQRVEESLLSDCGKDERIKIFQAGFSQLAGNIRTEPGTLEKIIDELQEPRKKKGRVAYREPGLHFTTRQAIQATLATALASAAGFAISPQRWYWAALASFFVFIGASRGDTLMRAVYRIVGTAAGLAVGFALANFTSGHHGLEWTVIIACVFLGIFGSRLAFGFWTAALFTLMIAVLFDILGVLTNTLLVLRLEETVVGAIIGAIIGSFVLPTSTRTTVKTSLAKLLRAISDVLEDLPIENLAARRKLVQGLRDIDYALQALRTAAAPMAGQITVMRRGEIPAILHDAAVLTHYVLHFSTMAPSESDVQELKARCERLREVLSLQADQLETGQVKAELAAGLSGAPERGSLDSPLFVMKRLEQATTGLSRRQL
jgi:uncharacterized membrane protein YccC